MIAWLTTIATLLGQGGRLIGMLPVALWGYVAVFAVPALVAGWLWFEGVGLKNDIAELNTELTELSIQARGQALKTRQALSERNQCLNELDRTTGVIEQAESAKAKIETDFNALQERIESMGDAECIDILGEAING